jgi:hypothetical protein
MQDEVKSGEAIIFSSIPPQASVRARFKALPGWSRFVLPRLAQNSSKRLRWRSPAKRALGSLWDRDSSPLTLWDFKK